MTSKGYSARCAIQKVPTLTASSKREAAESRKKAATSTALVVPAKPDTKAAVTAANLSVALGPPATA